MIYKYKKAIIWSIVGVLSVIIIFAVWVLSSLVTEGNADKRQAAAMAIEQTDMAEVTKVEAFSGDRSFMVVHGRSEQDEEMLVWLNDEEIHTQYASDGVDEERIRSQTVAKHPGIEILRVSPGKLQDVFIWEVFYKQTENRAEQYYYDYYQFSDGSLIDTYRLASP